MPKRVMSGLAIIMFLSLLTPSYCHAHAVPITFALLALSPMIIGVLATGALTGLIVSHIFEVKWKMAVAVFAGSVFASCVLWIILRLDFTPPVSFLIAIPTLFPGCYFLFRKREHGWNYSLNAFLLAACSMMLCIAVIWDLGS